MNCVIIGTITSEANLGCHRSNPALGLVWDNQRLLLSDGSLNNWVVGMWKYSEIILLFSVVSNI